jgi:alpha-amylase
VQAREAGLERSLTYDRHERRSALVHLLEPAVAAALGPAELSAERFEEAGAFAEAPFEIVDVGGSHLVVSHVGSVRSTPVTIVKRFELGGTRLEPFLDVAVEVRAETAGGEPAGEVALDLEWSLDLLGGGGNPHAWYRRAGSDERSPHDGEGDVPDASGLAFGNDHLGVRVDATLEPPARVTWHPVDTVSNSEAGFERIYQGSALHLRWTVTLGGTPERRRVRFAVTQARDLAEDDGTP